MLEMMTMIELAHHKYQPLKTDRGSDLFVARMSRLLFTCVHVHADLIHWWGVPGALVLTMGYVVLTMQTVSRFG